MSLSSHQMMWIVPWLKSFRCRPSQFLNHCEEILAMFELRPHHLIHTHWEFPGPNPTGVAWLHPSGRCPVNPNPSFDRTFLPYTVATDLSITIHIVGLRTAPEFKIGNRTYLPQQVSGLRKMALLYQLIAIQNKTWLYNLSLRFIATIFVCI